MANMNPTAKKIIRFIMGALLPVPLFVGIFYFSYFYTSYHGFDHESNTYITDPQNMAITRKHLITDFVVFIAMGYFLMGLPSLVYSFLLERYRTSSRYGLWSYVGGGALLGGIAGVIAISLGFVLSGGSYDSVKVVATSFLVGGIVPLLLMLIFRKSPVAAAGN
jgi:hypothetical protein